jgi:hypothetical protein
MKQKNSEKGLFFLIFFVLGFLSLQLKFTSIFGSDKPFSFFSFFSPLPGAFLGPLSGALAIFLIRILSLLSTSLDPISFNLQTLPFLLWGLPSIVGAIYFGSRRKGIALIPIVCIGLFILHPEGMKAWVYSLYWLIPLLVASSKLKFSAFPSALGATFAQHAVGSVIYLYAFGIKAEVWYTLIPITLAERLLFALGITATYLLMDNLLSRISSKFGLTSLRLGEKRLSISFS